MRTLASRAARAAAIALLALAVAACGSRDPSAVAPARGVLPAPPAPVDPALRVLVGGDVLPHRPRLLPAARIAAALAPLRSLFAEADATIANYETATGNPSALTDASKNIALPAPSPWMGDLARARI